MSTCLQAGAGRSDAQSERQGAAAVAEEHGGGAGMPNRSEDGHSTHSSGPDKPRRRDAQPFSHREYMFPPG
jgi:hypothetical protein